jgi:hypothetical protein
MRWLVHTTALGALVEPDVRALENGARLHHKIGRDVDVARETARVDACFENARRDDAAASFARILVREFGQVECNEKSFFESVFHRAGKCR